MDVNGDGHTDILSGSYSRMERDMAGLFQVLYGSESGFRKAEPLSGDDGELLIITSPGDDQDVDRICTRPTAVDLDGDGRLEIVSGNFTGTFALFAGHGEGKFAATSSMLTDTDGELLRVPAHSDPFFVDWDADGDLDLLSGSGQGGVFLFRNVGSKSKASFGPQEILMQAKGYEAAGLTFGDEHIQLPQTSTRVWADDLDGDGKLDLLVGDSVTLSYPAEGLSEAEATERYEAWEERQQELMKVRMETEGEPDEAELEQWQEAMQKVWEERETIIRSEMTGFVWVLYQK